MPRLYDPHDVCLVLEGPQPDRGARLLLDALAARDVAAKALVMPPGQTPADLRTLRYVADQAPPILCVRRTHGRLVLDPALFRGPFRTLHESWDALHIPGLAELTVECVKHAAHLYVATRWQQLPAVAAAAAYHDARVVFAPDAGELAHAPSQPARDDLVAVLHEHILRHVVTEVLVPHVDEYADYRALFAGRISPPFADVDALAAHLTQRSRHAAPAGPSASSAVRLERAHGALGTVLGDALTAHRADDPPLLSIAIPTYQRAPLLEHTLSSVIAQARRYGLEPLLELVVSDNASLDDTADVVARAARETAIPVRYACNDENRGVGYNVVRALERSSGTFCCLLGDDDFVIEGALPRLLAFLHAIAAPDDDATLAIFSDPFVPMAAAPAARRTLEEATREFFYHVGNLGLAVVRTAHVRPLLAERPWDALQRFWPQTELYFRAMQRTGASRPAMVIPIPVCCGPMHNALTRYTGRYRWDEAFFSLYEVALHLAAEMPGWFLPSIDAHYVGPRFGAVADDLLQRYAREDDEATREQVRQSLRGALRALAAHADLLGASGTDFANAIVTVLLRYASPTSITALRDVVAEAAESLAPPSFASTAAHS